MRFLLIVLGIITVTIAGVVVYALQVEAPETEIEVIISDDDLPQ